MIVKQSTNVKIQVKNIIYTYRKNNKIKMENLNKFKELKEELKKEIKNYSFVMIYDELYGDRIIYMKKDKDPFMYNNLTYFVAKGYRISEETVLNKFMNTDIVFQNGDDVSVYNSYYQADMREMLLDYLENKKEEYKSKNKNK